MRTSHRMIAAVLAASAALSGCTATAGRNSFAGITNQAPEKVVLAEMATITNLDKVLACVRPYTNGLRIALAQSIDNTGRTNSVSDAGIGNFAPGPQTVIAATKVLQQAGVTVQNLSNYSGENVYRQLITPQKLMALKAVSDKYQPNYYLDTSTLTLDFDRRLTSTLAVKGLGYSIDVTRATLSGGAQLVRADGSRVVDGNGGMKMSVFSSDGGAFVARIFDKALVTGEAGAGRQEPMQLWTAEYVVTITAIKALADIPQVPRRCGEMFKQFVQPDVVTI